MVTFIILDANAADSVRGTSPVDPAAALEPILRQGNTFILGLEVLADDAHSAHRPLLESLPQLDQDDPGFPGPLDPEV